MDGDLWTFNLAGWVLQDGGYPDLVVGDRIDFSVEVGPDARFALRDPGADRQVSTARRLRDDLYAITGTVAAESDTSILDVGGLRAWWEGEPPALPPASPLGRPVTVEGTARLGIDSLVGPRPQDGLPPLIYEWTIAAIDLVTTPWVPDPTVPAPDPGGPRGWVRDSSRPSRRPLDRTRMWDDDPPHHVAEYLVTCRLLHPEPGHERFHLGPRDPVRMRRALDSRWQATGCDVALRDELLAAYAQPHRGYHDLRHLGEVLENLERLECDDEAVLLAAWFHDAVYDGAADDEERSAAWAEQALAEDPALAEEVARLVRVTATHRPGAGDHRGQLLCDADLAILAAEPERHADYVDGVRAEYSHVPDPDFRAGRRAVLEDLLAKDRLFETEAGRHLWERAARANLRAEIAALS